MCHCDENEKEQKKSDKQSDNKDRRTEKDKTSVGESIRENVIE